MSDPRHQLSKTFISNVELEAIKKKNADLQFCLDKEVARVMALTQQRDTYADDVRLLEQKLVQAEQRRDVFLDALHKIGTDGCDNKYTRIASKAIAKAGGEA